jgi:SAM-dependent methyltransferase
MGTSRGTPRSRPSGTSSAPSGPGPKSEPSRGSGRGSNRGAGRDLENPVERGAHEHYADAALYDYEYRRRRDDVSFYCQLAGEALGSGGRVLELACGSGRVTTGLLRAGHHVVGLDVSLPMLRQAAARIGRLGRDARGRSALVCADMRSFALGVRFPLVIMAFNAFEHLYTRVEVRECLDRVRAHLEPGGRLMFDVQNPDLRWLSRDPTKRWARTRFTHPRTGQRMIYSTNHDYDPVSQIVVIRLYYEPAPGSRARRQVITLSQRKFFPAELEALLDANGFAVEARYGDFHGSPLEADGETQLVVCRPRG